MERSHGAGEDWPPLSYTKALPILHNPKGLFFLLLIKRCCSVTMVSREPFTAQYGGYDTDYEKSIKRRCFGNGSVDYSYRYRLQPIPLIIGPITSITDVSKVDNSIREGSQE